MLTVTPALWNLPLAQAQPAHSRQSQKTQQQAEKKHNTDRARRTQESEQTESKKQKNHYEGSVPIGGYFQDHHHEAAREYYGRQENRGYCPPGLAKKRQRLTTAGSCQKVATGLSITQRRGLLRSPTIRSGESGPTADRLSICAVGLGHIAHLCRYTHGGGCDRGPGSLTGP